MLQPKGCLCHKDKHCLLIMSCLLVKTTPCGAIFPSPRATSYQNRWFYFAFWRQAIRISASPSFFRAEKAKSSHLPPFLESAKKNRRIYLLFLRRQARIIASSFLFQSAKEEPSNLPSCFATARKNPCAKLPCFATARKNPCAKLPCFATTRKNRPKLVSVKRSDRGERSEDLLFERSDFFILVYAERRARLAWALLRRSLTSRSE